MDVHSDRRTFFETYTLPNIWNEIKLRLARARKLRDRQPVHPAHPEPYDGSHARQVGDFYDARHADFLEVYGDVIQAFRTKDITDLLNYQISSIGFAPGQRVLDAGCGVAVPAIYFAGHVHVQVDGITISRKQFDAAQQKIAESVQSEQVTVVYGDYHKLDEHFPAQSYDIVYFLESFGHSKAKARLINSCWEVLKPGGTLYIKDLFKRVVQNPEHKQAVDREIDRINTAYRYDVADLNAVLDDLRRRGFILARLGTIDLSLESFEDLAISNLFQELTGLARIENWNEYVFPVDFFEIKCIKPEFSLEERLDRHVLQQQYHLALEAKLRS
jgi:ubiquinone/menaquinone biosynthesis C-methylase UbiE